MELAGLTISEAVRRFRDEVLIQHRWDFRQGASLKTYFIGFCCIVYVDVYRRWQTDERQRPGEEGRA